MTYYTWDEKPLPESTDDDTGDTIEDEDTSDGYHEVDPEKEEDDNSGQDIFELQLKRCPASSLRQFSKELKSGQRKAQERVKARVIAGQLFKGEKMPEPNDLGDETFDDDRSQWEELDEGEIEDDPGEYDNEEYEDEDED